MIDLEVERLRTKTKVPAVFLGYDGYCDPLMAYDSFLAKYPQGNWLNTSSSGKDTRFPSGIGLGRLFMSLIGY